MIRLRKEKRPKDYVGLINENLQIINSPTKTPKEEKKASEEVTRLLGLIKELLVDKSDTRLTGKDKDAELSQSERARLNDVLSEIASELLRDQCLHTWINSLSVIDFEGSKLIVELCGQVFQRHVGSCTPASQYILANDHILLTLLEGYSKPDRVIHYGQILREACKHEAIANVVLHKKQFYTLFEHAQATAFDVSSDAFATLRDLLTRHKVIVAQFLKENYDTFFHHYTKLLQSNNYVPTRLALKLLAELLLDRHNIEMMKQYISSAENLKLIMTLLASKQNQIAFEAFHCFKNFVANTNKPEEVHAILYSNKEKLIGFLTNFQPDRTEDTQLKDEKAYLINRIRELTEPAAVSSKPSQPARARNDAVPTSDQL